MPRSLWQAGAANDLSFRRAFYNLREAADRKRGATGVAMTSTENENGRRLGLGYHSGAATLCAFGVTGCSATI